MQRGRKIKGLSAKQTLWTGFLAVMITIIARGLIGIKPEGYGFWGGWDYEITWLIVYLVTFSGIIIVLRIWENRRRSDEKHSVV
jgi:hypothetical protein